MEDCPSSGWDAVRTAHKQVLNTIEFKRLVWKDTEAVYKLKTEALMHIKLKTNDISAPLSNVQTLPCPTYQTATCIHDGQHTSEGFTFLHYCAFCLTQGKQHVHPIISCHKAKGTSKPKEGGK